MFEIGDRIRMNQTGRELFPGLSGKSGVIESLSRYYHGSVLVRWEEKAATQLYRISHLEKIGNLRELSGAEYKSKLDLLDKFNCAIPLPEYSGAFR